MTDRIFLLLSFAGCTFGARAADGHHDVRRAPRLRACAYSSMYYEKLCMELAIGHLKRPCFLKRSLA